jgi:hypothetical protein
LNLRGLAIIDLLEPTRRGRINGVTTDGYTVSVMWAVGDVQSVNVTDSRFVVEVPLREAARQRGD